MTEERNCELQNISIETSKMEEQTKKDWKHRRDYSRNEGQP